MAASDPRDLPIGDLLARLADQTARLVRAEIHLARAEMLEKGKELVAPAGLFGVAGAMGFGAFLALTATLIAALSLAMQVWAAALIVTLLYAAIAGVCVAAARSRLQHADPVPRETVETVKEDAEWIATRARSARR